MDTQTGRRNLASILLCAALALPILPASAQLTPLVPATTAPQQQRQGFVYSRSYAPPMSMSAASGRWYPPSLQPNLSPSSPYASSTNFGYSTGVPLSPGFGGNVAPRRGFVYEQGVPLGSGSGASSLPILNQNGNANGGQGQRYGTDGLPLLPTLPGYSLGGYSGSPTQAPANCPPLLGGYYFSNYTNAYAGGYTLPTAYALYGSFPTYFYVSDNVGVTVLPTAPAYSYDSGYLPYSEPARQVNNQYNYTVNNYYASPSGDGSASQAPQVGTAPPAAAAGSDLAFADIQKAWLSGSIELLQKHLRDSDVKIAVSIKGKYSYSIASGDFATITKDAFDKLTTYSFEFTSVRKQTNGDVTGYARHVYAPSSSADGTKQTIFLAFTLTKHKDQWALTAIDSSTTPMDDQGGTGKNDQSTAPSATGQRMFTSG